MASGEEADGHPAEADGHHVYETLNRLIILALVTLRIGTLNNMGFEGP